LPLIVENFKLVTPGEKIATGKEYTPGTGVFKKKIGKETFYYSSVTGLTSVRTSGRSKRTILTIIPMEGPYIPYPDDIVLGKIIHTGFTSWMVDIRASYSALLTASNAIERRYGDRDRSMNLSKYLNVGDIIVARVLNYDRNRDPVISMMGDRRFRKFNTGRLIEINPVKVPRIIGKNQSMINMLRDETKAQIEVGKNGRLLINTNSFFMEQLIVDAINKIVKESHVSGLTDRIKEMLIRRKQEIQEIGV